MFEAYLNNSQHVAPAEMAGMAATPLRLRATHSGILMAAAGGAIDVRGGCGAAEAYKAARATALTVRPPQ